MSCFDADDAVTGEMLGNLMQMLPGIPESVARDKLNQALRRFFRESGVWRFERHHQSVCAGDTLAEMPVDAGVEVVRVLDVFYPHCGCECELPQTGAFKRGCECLCQSGQAWLEHTPGKVLFRYPWAEGRELRYRLVLSPAIGSELAPKGLVMAHQQAIEAGALGMGYLIPGQAFSNAELGAFYMAGFREAVEKQRLQARLDLLPGRPTYRTQQGCF